VAAWFPVVVQDCLHNSKTSLMLCTLLTDEQKFNDRQLNLLFLFIAIQFGKMLILVVSGHG